MTMGSHLFSVPSHSRRGRLHDVPAIRVDIRAEVGDLTAGSLLQFIIATWPWTPLSFAQNYHVKCTYSSKRKTATVSSCLRDGEGSVWMRA
ncbi:hypothetical protein NC651_037364 [Populus alba x Populus x berolinensis]|nr:hypothetical protein NC651_037364 [Populus alba x Populus x berolinensis]